MPFPKVSHEPLVRVCRGVDGKRRTQLGGIRFIRAHVAGRSHTARHIHRTGHAALVKIVGTGIVVAYTIVSRINRPRSVF